MMSELEFYVDTTSWAFLFAVEKFTDHIRITVLCFVAVFQINKINSEGG